MDAGQCLSAEINLRIQCQHAKNRGDLRVTNSGSPSPPQSRSHSPSRSPSKVARRWTVIASGLLILALGLVVIYTRPNAFYSPTALVVVAAIGLAALLLQVWFRRDLPIRSPRWLNILGIVCAMVTLFADYLRITRRVVDVVAFAAVLCFGISGSLILQALRKQFTLASSTGTKHGEKETG